MGPSQNDILRPDTQQCLAAAAALAGGRVVATGDVLNGIIGMLECLASRTLWSFGLDNPVVRHFRESGQVGEFSTEMKAVLESAISAGSDRLPQLYAQDERVTPAGLALGFLRVCCEARRVLDGIGVDIEAFRDRLTLLHTGAFGYKESPLNSGLSHDFARMKRRLPVIAESLPYAALVIRATVASDTLSLVGREALKKFTSSCGKLESYFVEDVGVRRTFLDIHPGVPRPSSHDPRQQLVLAGHYLEELERCALVPLGLIAEARIARRSAVRLHDCRTLCS